MAADRAFPSLLYSLFLLCGGFGEEGFEIDAEDESGVDFCPGVGYVVVVEEGSGEGVV